MPVSTVVSRMERPFHFALFCASRSVSSATNLGNSFNEHFGYFNTFFKFTKLKGIILKMIFTKVIVTNFLNAPFRPSKHLVC